MINDAAVKLALRARALTLSVATTGSTTLEATTTGYARAAGSFLTDGFVAGMEIAPTGFTATAAGLIDAISSDGSTMTIRGGRSVESPASGRSLTAGLPGIRVYGGLEPREAGVVVDLDPNRWFVEEEYVPGPREQMTLGPQGEVEGLPQYNLRAYAPQNTGSAALEAFVAATLALFEPRMALTASTGDVVRIRSRPAPFPGPLLPGPPGWATMPVTIPCLVRSPCVN